MHPIACTIIHTHSLLIVMIYCRCERGVLTNCYPSSELMPYQGTANFKYTQESPTVTLRKAVMTRKGGTISATALVLAKEVDVLADTSVLSVQVIVTQIIPLKCLNKDNSENNDKCIITRVESSSSVSSLSKRRKNQVQLQYKWKRRKVAVDHEKRKIIKEGGWLNDKHIEAANNYIAEEAVSQSCWATKSSAWPNRCIRYLPRTIHTNPKCSRQSLVHSCKKLFICCACV